ncbi:lytic polysaccharide monooxygenase [Pectobacterium parvum]|uniref:Lytic polysaccharide monooxygenase n=1 Tax=Pectobacterium parvum TaxID=2778550 RepID=A0ABW8G0P7_9GAMM|nr:MULTISPECIES: lytic polysaccharide monooxygenase [Pectobacterium]KFX13056.1 chitin-binding protein [Pectobacterium parvum]UFK39361.1 lytic polysaccharide monooxygenase [Pectobacterium parvum]UVD97491.1 lytic polysaccharide monooxygenase [Pectobacterium parvum]GKW42208.1 chitin-binding protein [Pectobacterium carotovorum subsp. carotovorum]
MKKLLHTSIISGALLMMSSAYAENISPRHGFVNNPPSRAFLCSAGGGNLNKNCGGVQYEPQSVEGSKGFPSAGPKDGEIASGGKLSFNELNAQSATRWRHIDINTGKQTFTWNLTAPHSTESWKFYITKENWNPNQPLSREQLNLTAFCERSDSGKVPTSTVNVECVVPNVKSGYYIILAVWNIADTGNAFYQVIDANIK